jgi:hypothetical protein
VVSASTASAEYRPAGEPGKSTDLGGCINMLNPSKSITKKSHGIRPNTTLIQVEKWTGVDTWRPAGGGLMAKKWNLIVDIARCNNCRVCFIAVKDEHIGNDFPGYAAAQPAQGHNWLDIRRKERGSTRSSRRTSCR